ncbi:MAG: ABC transporter substrate-binding protein, partial [Desulfurococcales archaeon]|nr:ABC transporter substrate-binding protein [Desulfurococcales archaeon]
MSRKALSKMAAAIALVVIIVVAAAAWYFAGKGTTTEEQPEQVVVIGVTDKVTDLDPANAYDFFTWEVLSNIMAGLVKYDPDTGKIVGDLATDWEVQDNGSVWIFHLRQDAKFADGTPCTAHDVVRSIERVMNIQGDPSWLVT